MLVTVGLLVLSGVGLCLAYKSDRERPWLLTLLAVTVGLVLLLAVPELGGLAFVLAGHLVVWTRRAAEAAAPFLLLAGLVVVLRWLGRRWWRHYPAFGPLGRGRVLLLSITLGAAVAAVLRVVPYLPDAARIATEGARAGVSAGVEKAVDEAADESRLNGGDALP